jgi:hypothetical protein
VSKKSFNIEKDISTYKRDLAKRIELINWVLENFNNPDIENNIINRSIESKMLVEWAKTGPSTGGAFDSVIFPGLIGGSGSEVSL